MAKAKTTKVRARVVRLEVVSDAELDEVEAEHAQSETEGIEGLPRERQDPSITVVKVSKKKTKAGR